MSSDTTSVVESIRATLSDSVSPMMVARLTELGREIEAHARLYLPEGSELPRALRFQWPSARHADAETLRENWHRAVVQELDELCAVEPEAYQAIPRFLTIPIEEIDGMSYHSCFYGKLNNGNSFFAQLMSNKFQHIAPTHRKFFGQSISPIEMLVMCLFHGKREMFTMAASEFEGVTREMLRGWIQEHYRKHQVVVSTLVSECVEQLKEMADGDGRGTPGDDLCRA